MYEPAVTANERGFTLAGEDPRAVAALREAYQTSGMNGYRRKHIDLLKERSTRTYVSPIWIAMDYASLGDKERAFEWLEKAYAERAGWLLELRIDPTWDPLRTDPRFKELLERVRNARIVSSNPPIKSVKGLRNNSRQPINPGFSSVTAKSSDCPGGSSRPVPANCVPRSTNLSNSARLGRVVQARWDDGSIT